MIMIVIIGAKIIIIFSYIHTYQKEIYDIGTEILLLTSNLEARRSEVVQTNPRYHQNLHTHRDLSVGLGFGPVAAF